MQGGSLRELAALDSLVLLLYGFAERIVLGAEGSISNRDRDEVCVVFSLVVLLPLTLALNSSSIISGTRVVVAGVLFFFRGFMPTPLDHFPDVLLV